MHPRLFYAATVAVTKANIWIVDLPGAGTPEFPMFTYASEMGLMYMSCVILVTEGTSLEFTANIIKHFEAVDLPFIIALTKVDQIAAQCVS